MINSDEMCNKMTENAIKYKNAKLKILRIIIGRKYIDAFTEKNTRR